MFIFNWAVVLFFFGLVFGVLEDRVKIRCEVLIVELVFSGERRIYLNEEESECESE